MFDGKVETLKLFAGSSISFFAYRLGDSGRFLWFLIVLMAVDTATGWLLHSKLGDWNSKSARWGFVGKIIELTFIGLLYMLDYVFNADYLKYIGIFYFMICEAASVAENMAGLNSDIPPELGQLLAKTKFSVGTLIIKKANDFIKKYINIGSDKEDKQNEDK